LRYRDEIWLNSLNDTDLKAGFERLEASHGKAVFESKVLDDQIPVRNTNIER
jgi:hypothetical protein